jgi:hypothetical protein
MEHDENGRIKAGWQSRGKHFQRVNVAGGSPDHALHNGRLWSRPTLMSFDIGREASRPSLSFVPVKGLDQQGLSTLYGAHLQPIG